MEHMPVRALLRMSDRNRMRRAHHVRSVNTKQLDDAIVDALVSVAFLFFVLVLVIGTPDRFGCGKQVGQLSGTTSF